MKSTAAGEMTIGELAGRFGPATHVLRHWESMGLLAPERRANGRRRYTDADVTRIGVILCGKDAGLELGQVRALLGTGGAAERHAVLAAQRAELDLRIARATAARELLAHGMECGHDDVLGCPYFRQAVQDRIAEASRDPARTQDLDLDLDLG